MRRSKIVFALFEIGLGLILLLLGFIKSFYGAFLVAAGAAVISWGIVSLAFEHFIHKVWRIKIMDEDERNLSINGKAYTLTSDFTHLGLIVLALYSAICMEDMAGCVIAIIIFLLSHVVYVVAFKYFDKNSMQEERCCWAIWQPTYPQFFMATGRD